MPGTACEVCSSGRRWPRPSGDRSCHLESPHLASRPIASRVLSLPASFRRRPLSQTSSPVSSPSPSPSSSPLDLGRMSGRARIWKDFRIGTGWRGLAGSSQRPPQPVASRSALQQARESPIHALVAQPGPSLSPSSWPPPPPLPPPPQPAAAKHERPANRTAILRRLPLQLLPLDPVQHARTRETTPPASSHRLLQLGHFPGTEVRPAVSGFAANSILAHLLALNRPRAEPPR